MVRSHHLWFWLLLLLRDVAGGGGFCTVVSSMPRPHFTSGEEPVPILQETGWAPGTVWTGGKSRPRRDSITDRPARSQSLYRLSYTAHVNSIDRSVLCKDAASCYDDIASVVGK